MKHRYFEFLLTAILMLTLFGCGKAPAADHTDPSAEPQVTADVHTPEEDSGQTAVIESDQPAAESGRQDGERFEKVIILEGMEETVRYEHVINGAVGFEMDYEYEEFVRNSEADRERFISTWDDPSSPENYLEVVHSTMDAETTAASITELLSQDYDVMRDSRRLEGSGDCIRIEASVIKGTDRMADRLQEVYIIPASEGCCVATAHYAVEGAEGFGRRFAYMLNTLEIISISNA